MNPKHLRLRMDQVTGAIFLTDERMNNPVRKVKDVTADVLLALAADLVAEDGTQRVERDVRIGDFTARITIEAIDDTGNPT